MKRERDREKQEERFLNIQQSKETQSYLINKKKKSPLKMTSNLHISIMHNINLAKHDAFYTTP